MMARNTWQPWRLRTGSHNRKMGITKSTQPCFIWVGVWQTVWKIYWLIYKMPILKDLLIYWTNICQICHYFNINETNWKSFAFQNKTVWWLAKYDWIRLGCFNDNVFNQENLKLGQILTLVALVKASILKWFLDEGCRTGR